MLPYSRHSMPIRNVGVAIGARVREELLSPTCHILESPLGRAELLFESGFEISAKPLIKCYQLVKNPYPWWGFDPLSPLLATLMKSPHMFTDWLR